MTRRVLFAAEEDFGIAPLEAQACGTPVIAYGKGGALETIYGHDGPDQTGVFFAEQTVPSIVAAVEHLNRRQDAITPAACRANVRRFSVERFRLEFAQFVERVMADHADALNGGVPSLGGVDAVALATTVSIGTTRPDASA